MSSDSPIDNILPRLSRVRQQGKKGKWRAQCPVCGSKDGLNLTEHQGVLLAHCFACDTDNGDSRLASALGLEPRDFWANGERRGWEIVRARYQYIDADGVLLYEKVRLANKGFRFVGPDGNTPGIPEGTPHVLYRLPEVNAAIALGKRIYIVEGEKDVETLRLLQLVATTQDGGASSDWRESDVEIFRSALDVVILPDNDAPGRAYAERAANALAMVGGRVRVVKLNGLPPKGDVSDWLAGQHTLDELESLLRVTPEWTPGDHVSPFTKRDDAKAFLARQLDNGPERASAVEARAKASGISSHTLQRAKAQLGVRSSGERREDGTLGPWYWSLPSDAASESVIPVDYRLAENREEDVLDGVTSLPAFEPACDA